MAPHKMTPEQRDNLVALAGCLWFLLRASFTEDVIDGSYMNRMKRQQANVEGYIRDKLEAITEDE